MLQDSAAYSGFSIKDAGETREFYGGLLGLTVTDVPGMEQFGILHLQIANGPTILMYQNADHEPATFTVLNFIVGDIDVAVDELTGKGIAMIRYDNPDTPQDDKGILRGLQADMGPDIAWFADPSGNILAVQQTQ